MKRDDVIEYLIKSGYDDSILMESVEIKNVRDTDQLPPRRHIYLIICYLTKYDHHPKSMAIPMESLKRYVRDRKIRNLLD